MKKALKSLVSVLAAGSLMFVPDSQGQTTGSASSKPTEVRIGYLLPLSAENAKKSIGNQFKGFGCLRGQILISQDFDKPVEEFKDYEP